MSRLAATLTLASAVSTTSSAVSGCLAAAPTTGSAVSTCSSPSGMFTRDSRAVNGLVGCWTKVPRPCLVTTRPWLVSSAIASRTVFLDAWYSSTRSGSLGSRSPGANTPVVIWSRRRSAICWYRA